MTHEETLNNIKTKIDSLQIHQLREFNDCGVTDEHYYKKCFKELNWMLKEVNKLMDDE